MKTIKVGDPRDFSLINAVIHKNSFNKLKSIIQKAKKIKKPKLYLEENMTIV